MLGKLLSGKTLVPGSRLLMNAYQHRLNSSQPFDEIARPVTRLRSRNKLLQSVSYLDRARWDADLLPRVGLDGPFFVASRERQHDEDDLHVLGSIALSWCVKQDSMFTMLKPICS